MADASVKVHVQNLTTDETVFGLDVNTPAPPASLTKMMTLLIAARAISDKNVSNFNLNSKVPITDIAIRRSRGLVGSRFKQGDVLSMQKALRKTGANSDPKATIALAMATADALGVSGTEEQKYAWFVRQMNKTAKEFGMNNTTFVNVTGDNGNIGTPAAFNKLQAAFYKQHPNLMAIAMDGRHGHSSRVVDTHRTVLMGKTGFLRLAGYNESVIFRAKNGDLFALTMFGADSSAHRAALIKKYMKWVNNPHLVPAAFKMDNNNENTAVASINSATAPTFRPAKSFALVADNNNEEPLKSQKQNAVVAYASRALDGLWDYFQKDAAPATATAPRLQPTTKPFSLAATNSNNAYSQNSTYTMKAGDTLWGLAIKHGYSVKDAYAVAMKLKRDNGIADERNIQIDTKINMRSVVENTFALAA